MCLKKFHKEFLILIKFCLCFVFGHWAKRNRPSGKIVSDKWSKLLSMYPKKSSEEKIYIEESVFYSFLIPESKKISLFIIFFMAGFQWVLSTCPKGSFEKKIFLKKFDLFYFHVRTLSKKPSVPCQHIFGRILKTAIYLPIGTFREIIFRKKFSPCFSSSDIELKNLGPMAFFSANCRKCILNFQKLILRKKVSLKKKFLFFFFFFGHWVEYCQIYVEKLWAGISKLHSMFWKLSVEETLVFSIWLNFF